MSLMPLSTINFEKHRCPSFALKPAHADRYRPKFLMAATPAGLGTTDVRTINNSFRPAREVHDQILHSMPPEKMEIFKAMEDWVDNDVLIHLKPVEECWQPHDYLPIPSSADFYDQVKELREKARKLPDDYFVVLIGDMITEEALPTYLTFFNSFDGIRDETGASLTPWAIWGRAWIAEENRHGDFLNKYLYLSGRVDMRQIEKTIQYLIGSGMYLKTENNPYLGFIHASFQERATFMSHGRTGRIAKEHGDLQLGKICGLIASDEKRHETAYTKITEKLFEIDPDNTMLAFYDVMKRKITMPGHLMYDGRDDNLFQHFSVITQRLGVYTAKDYTEILEHFITRWKIEYLTGLSSEGRRAQEFICNLPQRFRSLEERAQKSVMQAPKIKFSWIYDRMV